MTTLMEVARRAGVSIASASRALNGESASPRTVELVERAARELAYVPDARARGLKRGSTGQLAFGVADVGNHVYVEMMRAVEATVGTAGYRVLISSVGSTVETEVALLRSLASGYVDGLVISPLRVDDELLAELAQLRVPVVVVGLLPHPGGFDNVRANSAAGVALAVEHLLVTGRERIGFVNGPEDTTPGRVRGEAFTDACRRSGMDEHRVVAADFTFAAGLDAARELLDRPGAGGAPLDAVVAANDLIAAGVYHAAAERGLRIGTDLAVVGMDDSALAAQLLPTLTSVDLGAADRGRHAAELLLARLREPGRPAQAVVVEPTLVVRSSTAPSQEAGDPS
ncbi:transcriptional regulator, LacI family [Microlunatus sagamiharensis]|uniref:Transcriptional regulator, LacI family n=1 Tax=Microlunatus sagamiharensis TaxID=546874 RepID=A0A1H2MG32_9ACTN|nr:LacI family DNA-binding transcriptional regulator [Microlunatus sagamiharensis]SDU91446.1 transcriptional regulator, LacI family [Microlunatus sagamiharensis]